MNWYKNTKTAQQQQQNQESRYQASIIADIFVPIMDNPEQELEIAKNVLKSNLNQIEGDASLHTGINSHLNFSTQNIQKFL